MIIWINELLGVFFPRIDFNSFSIRKSKTIAFCLKKNLIYLKRMLLLQTFLIRCQIRYSKHYTLLWLPIELNSNLLNQFSHLINLKFSILSLNSSVFKLEFQFINEFWNSYAKYECSQAFQSLLKVIWHLGQTFLISVSLILDVVLNSILNDFNRIDSKIIIKTLLRAYLCAHSIQRGVDWIKF